ncbi:MAG: rod shape-determining protein MreD [Limnohabitans sp.]|jgi:rod shape-determining protein MreD
MIMPAGRPLLLPANPRFIALSLLLALMLHMLLGLTNQGWMPDMLAVVLAFWTVHQPRRVGMLSAFLLGLAVDVHESALLGQNALAYIGMSHLASVIGRRVLWFPLRKQPLQVLPLFILASTIEWLVRLLTDDLWPQWPQLIAPLLQTALWPLFGYVLLAPQRRPVDRDDIRPL